MMLYRWAAIFGQRLTHLIFSTKKRYRSWPIRLSDNEVMLIWWRYGKICILRAIACLLMSGTSGIETRLRAYSRIGDDTSRLP